MIDVLRHVASFWVVTLTLTALLAACAGEPPHHHQPVLPTPLVLSPNGEPLNGGTLGQRPCPETMAGWFERLDADHDGRLALDEFLTDARAQFARMDVYGDGSLTPDGLARYREPFRDQPPARTEPDRRRPSLQPSGTRLALGYDTVMSADANIDFRVSQAEFLAQAEAFFHRLDANHDGTLSRGEALSWCPPAPARGEAVNEAGQPPARHADQRR